MFLALVIVLVSAAVSCLMGSAANRILLRHEIIDSPNQRSSHTRPTVRGGGIAIIATVAGAGLWLIVQSEPQPLLAIGLGMLALAVVSFIDDLRSIPVFIRLACHTLAAVMVLISLRISSVALVLSPEAGFALPMFAGGILGCLWIIGHTNAFNFMDGINGIAAGQAAVTGVGMAVLAALPAGDFIAAPVLLSLAVGGAALGFLPHNFPKARMFMGDVGSAPLGFLLSVLVLWLAQIAGWWLLIPLALLHANFVLDTGITFFRRLARGDRLYEPHREHFYQRLIRSGRSHAFVTNWEMGLQCLVLGLMLLYLHAGGPMRATLIVLVVLIWLSFFAFCEVSFRRHTYQKSATAEVPNRIEEVA